MTRIRTEPLLRCKRRQERCGTNRQGPIPPQVPTSRRRSGSAPASGFSALGLFPKCFQLRDGFQILGSTRRAFGRDELVETEAGAVEPKQI